MWKIIIKKIWDKIKKYITPINIPIILAFIFMCLYFNQCSKTRFSKKELQKQEQIANQNYKALNDSIVSYRNKVGNISFSKPIAEMNKDDIKKYFPKLYETLKNELGEVKVVWEAYVQYRDTGSVKNAILQIDEDKYSLNYEYYSNDSSLYVNSSNTFFVKSNLINNDFNKYNIVVSPGISTINDLSLNISLTTGIKKDKDGIYRIFVTPSSDKIKITSIEGADVSSLLIPKVEKKKKWSVGPCAGIGVGLGEKNIMLTPVIGISIQYSIFNF